MTPFELTILIHYYGCANDFRDGDFTAPICKGTFTKFVTENLLECVPPEECKYASYRLTERGHVFVDALRNLPLPVKLWIMPKD